MAVETEGDRRITGKQGKRRTTFPDWVSAIKQSALSPSTVSNFPSGLTDVFCKEAKNMRNYGGIQNQTCKACFK